MRVMIPRESKAAEIITDRRNSARRHCSSETLSSADIGLAQHQRHSRSSLNREISEHTAIHTHTHISLSHSLGLSLALSLSFSLAVRPCWDRHRAKTV